jgi:hypothetical protein
MGDKSLLPSPDGNDFCRIPKSLQNSLVKAGGTVSMHTTMIVKLQGGVTEMWGISGRACTPNLSGVSGHTPLAQIGETPCIQSHHFGAVIANYWRVIMGESSGSRPCGASSPASICKRLSSLIVTSMLALDGSLWA